MIILMKHRFKKSKQVVVVVLILESHHVVFIALSTWCLHPSHSSPAKKTRAGSFPELLVRTLRPHEVMRFVWGTALIIS